MPDKLADILKIHLVVENESIRALLLEILELCQPPNDPGQARLMLDTKVHKFSSNVDQLHKVPYCQLFLSYVYVVLENNEQAAKYAAIAVDGFDQLNHVWNRSIARWMCGLILKKNGNLDDAELVFDTAIELMTQEMQDHKRRSRYEMAKKCALVLEKMRVDAHPQKKSLLTYLVSPGFPESVPGMNDPGTTSSEEDEAESYQDLLSKVGGNEVTAENLIEYEYVRTPMASRVELIRMAIARLERDNQ